MGYEIWENVCHYSGPSFAPKMGGNAVLIGLGKSAPQALSTRSPFAMIGGGRACRLNPALSRTSGAIPPASRGQQYSLRRGKGKGCSYKMLFGRGLPDLSSSVGEVCFVCGAPERCFLVHRPLARSLRRPLPHVGVDVESALDLPVLFLGRSVPCNVHNRLHVLFTDLEVQHVRVFQDVLFF